MLSTQFNFLFVSFFLRLEYLPKDEDRSISEYEYTVKHIGPVMQAFFESKNVTSHL